jgi:hypothetical protein
MLIQSKPCKRCGKTTYSNEWHWCPRLIPWLLTAFGVVAVITIALVSLAFLADAVSVIDTVSADASIAPTYVPGGEPVAVETPPPDPITWAVAYVGAYTVLEDDLTKQGNPFGDTYVSKGRFHVVQVTAYNGGAIPVDCSSFSSALSDTQGCIYAPAQVPWAGLSINGVAFAESPEVLQPGETVRFMVGFDVPSATAMPSSVFLSTDAGNTEFTLR